MKQKLFSFLRSENGATAIEYAIIAGSIVTAIAAVIGLLGGNLTGMFQRVLDGFN